MLYSYQVRDKLGNKMEGYLEAENHQAVINYLLQKHFFILDLHEEKLNSSVWFKSVAKSSSNKVKTRDLSSFMRQLATMLSTGLPMIKCFEVLAAQTSNIQLRKTAAKIEASLKTGLSLHEAMAIHDKVFSPIFISMIRAGELGGSLTAILLRIAEQVERENQINNKVKSASVYPTIITIVAIVEIVFILAFILPSFMKSISVSGTELPFFTALLLGVGNFIKDNLALLLFITGGLIIGFVTWGKTSSGRLSIDRVYLQLPLVGNVIKKVEVARFTRLLGLLISSGVPILAAFQVLEGVVGNQVIASAIKEVSERIKEGHSIAGPLNKTGLFEPMVTQMISIGEETGTLESMLGRLASFYETEVNYAVDSLMSVIEPLLIIIVALVIGAIIIAIYLPVFNLVTTMGI